MVQERLPRRARKKRSRDLHPDAERVLDGKLYRVEEVAQILQVGETEVRKLISGGELVAARIAGSYRMTVAAIRAYVQARNEEAAEAAIAKREERARARELERRQQRDPSLRWAIAHCVRCGIEPVLSTRNDRLSGHVCCDACDQEAQMAAARGGRFEATKDVIEREVAIKVRELDKQAEEELSFVEAMERDEDIRRRVREAESVTFIRFDGDDEKLEARRASLIAEAKRRPPHSFTFRCPLCGKPRPISREMLFGDGYPLCRHEAPHSLSGDYAKEARRLETEHLLANVDVPGPEWDVADLFHPEIVLAVAEMEASQRNIEDGRNPDPDLGEVLWFICRCAHCGRDLAVARRDERLIGQTCCRICGVEQKVMSPFERADVIVDLLASWDPEARPRRIRCSCGGWDVVINTNGESVRLTWCTSLAEKERIKLALAWADRFKLSKWRTTSLTTSVSDAQVLANIDDGDLEDLPF